MVNGISAKNTHDLWVEARQFTLELSRPTPTTIRLTISYPDTLEIVDGVVLTLHDKPISPSNYPVDGMQYTGSLDFTAPVDRIRDEPGGAHVVSFNSAVLGSPMPGVASTTPGRLTFSVDVINTSPTGIYYASVHPFSNVLQYYPIGVQSYPLESSRIEKDSTTYTGNIPTLPSAPISPTPNMVYFDSVLGLVQYWNGTVWLPSRTDAIPTGPVNPGTLGQTYFYTYENRLMIFNGTKWVKADSTNLQLRQGMTWIPLGSVTSRTNLPDTPAVGDFVWNYTTGRGQYWDGTDWIYPSAANSLFGIIPGGPFTPAFTNVLQAEPVALPNPHIGMLFYNTNQKVLNVWTGTEWVQANTDQQGTPTTDKIAIGSDGSYDERVRLANIIKSELGWPTVCNELKEEHFNVAIDNALDTYRQLSDHAYRMQYVLFTLIDGQQTYYLNDPVSKTDRIVSVNKIHRLNILGAEALSWDSNIYFQTFLNQYYSAGYTDILSIHLLHNLSEEFQRIFAGDLPFLWDEATRELFISRKISRNEKVILECQMEKTEQELLLDRWCKQFLQNYAIAECKYILGMIRSKYSSGTPGPTGAINLNGELLISEARQDQTELREQLLNYEFGGLVGKGNASFLIG